MEAKEFWKSINEVRSLMVRIGEKIPSFSSGNSFDRMVEESKLPFILSEGLIKSYPIDQVVRSISNIFNLKKINETDEPNLVDKLKGKEKHGYAGEIKSEADKNTDFTKIKIVLNDPDLIDEINIYMKKYGWACTEKYDGEFVYERKFDVFVIAKRLMLAGCNFIYHVTPSKLKDKILKQGIVPKNKGDNGFTDNFERNYFFVYEPDDDRLNDFCYYKNSESVCLFEVDLSKINPTTKLYFDPRTDKALYCLEPIPTAAISLLKEHTIEKNE